MSTLDEAIQTIRTWVSAGCTGTCIVQVEPMGPTGPTEPTDTPIGPSGPCLLYTSDAADE